MIAPRSPAIWSVWCAAALAVGCATQPAHRQSWIELTTPHFEISSSLSPDDTLKLAADIEGFRSAVEFMTDPDHPAPPVRTRVYAYDGRGFVRPFDVRGESGFFLSSLRGGVIVLRTGSGWRGDATEQLRHDYAHYLFRQVEGLDRPLWFDEGFGLLASTAIALDGGADIGSPPTEQLRLLKDRIWMKFDTIIGTRDLTDLPSRHHRMFRAESWILVHHVLLGNKSVARDRSRVKRYFDGVGAGRSSEASFQAAFGTATATLKSELTQQLFAGTYPSVKLRTPAPWDAPPVPRPLDAAQAASRLGWLSIVMGRPEQAREYFTLAIADDPSLAHAHLGLGAVDKLGARWEDAKPHYAKALELAPDDAIVQLETGGYYHARASRSADDAVRAELAKLARAHYQRSLEIDNAIPETWAVIGASFLLPGEDFESALKPLLTAQALLPSSLEIQLLLASQRVASGLTVEAHRLALGVFNRTHSDDLAESARALLERIDRAREQKRAAREQAAP